MSCYFTVPSNAAVLVGDTFFGLLRGPKYPRLRKKGNSEGSRNMTKKIFVYLEA